LKRLPEVARCDRGSVSVDLRGCLSKSALIFLLAQERLARIAWRWRGPVSSNTISGDPDPKHVSTSYVERQNLTMRMSMRRFTRLTNAFSKKLENHAAMVALYFMYYNFGRVHQTLRVTPAMEAGIADHIWSIAEIVGLLS
jgi:hypothetical protein